MTARRNELRFWSVMWFISTMLVSTDSPYDPGARLFAAVLADIADGCRPADLVSLAGR
jgi:hypothetical protein